MVDRKIDEMAAEPAATERPADRDGDLGVARRKRAIEQSFRDADQAVLLKRTEN